MTAQPQTLERVPMRYIMQTLEMSDDAIRAAGYSVNALLHIDEAIDFLSNRVKPRARWSVDKAQKTQTLLSDLQKRLPAFPETATPAPVAAPVEAQEMETAQSVSMTIQAFWAICIIVVVAHAGLIWYDAAQIWGTAGIFGGGLAFLIQLAALLVSCQSEQAGTSEWALLLVGAIDFGAWFLHFPTFLAENEYSGVVVSTIQTGFMAGFICIFSFGALAMFRNSRI